MCNLRHRLFSHLMNQEIGFFDRIRTGELMNRLSEVPSTCDQHYSGIKCPSPYVSSPLKHGIYTNMHQALAWFFDKHDLPVWRGS